MEYYEFSTSASCRPHCSARDSGQRLAAARRCQKGSVSAGWGSKAVRVAFSL